MNASHGKTFDLNLNCLLSKFSNEIVINWFDSDNDSHLRFTERKKNACSLKQTFAKKQSKIDNKQKSA